ncbi:MAG: hypothetical protein ACUVWZ_06085 [Anaerolineae bacterium]
MGSGVRAHALEQAVSDPTGDIGLRIIRAIVAGERDPHRLAALRHPWCKKGRTAVGPCLHLVLS